MKKPLNRPSTTVYISNLSYERDRQGLKVLFSRYGSIRNIKIIVEPTTNQSRGMAFVEMKTVEEATRAIEGLDGQVIDGRTVKANFAIPQKEDSKTKTEKPKKVEKDLEYTSIQLAKKARNDARRKAEAEKFNFSKKASAKKAPVRKVTKKKT